MQIPGNDIEGSRLMKNTNWRFIVKSIKHWHEVHSGEQMGKHYVQLYKSTSYNLNPKFYDQNEVIVSRIGETFAQQRPR